MNAAEDISGIQLSQRDGAAGVDISGLACLGPASEAVQMRGFKLGFSVRTPASPQLEDVLPSVHTVQLGASCSEVMSRHTWRCTVKEALQ